MSLKSFIEAAQNNSKYLDGNLSIEFGFLPKEEPSPTNNDNLKEWEELSERIPELYFKDQSQEEIENLTPLDIDKIKGQDITRAVSVMSLLASAYWRHGTKNKFSIRNTIEYGELPKVLEEPWIELSKKLNREKAPYQSSYDLFMNNYKLKPDLDYNVENIKIENLEVLNKSFGNEPERIFYMSFVEIHAALTPVVKCLCEIENAIKSETLSINEKFDEVSLYLNKISSAIKQANRALVKISPVKRSRTFCDPIQWAKTVGVFALPPANYTQGGTSGTSTPMVHVLDAICGRKSYDSYYGEYVSKEGEPLLPLVIKEFTKLVYKLDVKSWIENQEAKNDEYANLIDSFNNLIDTYTGANGFLDKHTAKVFNYLGVATFVGRNESTSGHQRYITKETWKKVSDELKIAQFERKKLFDEEIQLNSKLELNIEESENDISSFELIKHYKTNDALIAINSNVFEVTSYLELHPGGKSIIQPYLGHNATQEFNMVSGHSTNMAQKLLSKYWVGKLTEERNYPEFQGYEKLLKAFTRTYNIIDLQLSNEIKELKSATLNLTQIKNQFISDLLQNLRSLLEDKGFSIRFNNSSWKEFMDYMSQTELESFENSELEELHKNLNQLLKFGQSLLEGSIDFIVDFIESKNSITIDELEIFIQKEFNYYEEKLNESFSENFNAV